MSVRVMAEVWDTILDPPHKYVLLAYADHANDDGSAVYPGEEVLMRKTGYSQSSIRRITRDLVESGLLEQVARGHKGQRAAYNVNVARVKGYQDDTLSDDAKGVAGEPKGYRPRTQRVSPTNAKGVVGSTPNHPEPPVTTLEPSIVPAERKRDLLWESFVEVHGEPATKSERGKYNATVKKLREADVTPDEYPMLVGAYSTKYPDLQPAVATVAERVGELRHFIKRGPVSGVALDDIKRAQDLAALEAEWGTDGKEALP